MRRTWMIWAGACLLAGCSGGQTAAPQGRAVTYGQAPATYAAQPPAYPYAPGSQPTYTAAPTYSGYPNALPPPPPPPNYTPRPGDVVPIAVAPGYGAPNYAAPTPPPSYAAAPPMAASPTAARPGPSAWQWHTRLGDAQADARGQGKVILVMSTKPHCGLCDKFKYTVVPQIQSDLSQMAVGYVYDITAPESHQIDNLLRRELIQRRGGTLMPLVGFVTPDLQWVDGFSGPTDAGQFSALMGSVRRTHPVHARVPVAAPASRTVAATRVGGGTTKVNEYGEMEWSPYDDVVPEDAIVGDETAVAPPAAPPARQAPLAPVVADPIPIEPPPTPDPVASAPEAASTPEVAAVPATPEPAPTYPSPSDVSTTVTASMTWSPPISTTSASAPSFDADKMWAEALLESAVEQIRAGRLDEARLALGQVIARLPDTEYARDAARGTVAIHNARKIQRAAEQDRTALLEQARRDLGDSRWSPIFR